MNNLEQTIRTKLTQNLQRQGFILSSIKDGLIEFNLSSLIKDPDILSELPFVDMVIDDAHVLIELFEEEKQLRDELNKELALHKWVE